MKISALFLLVLLPGMVEAADYDRAQLRRLADNMAQVRTMKADFEQTADGKRSSGTFVLRRPGKARFNYKAPSTIRIISDGFWVAVEDSAARTQDRAPVNRTPLAILLDDRPSFENDKILVDNVRQEAGETIVSVRDAAAPDNGTLALRFNDQERLSGWTVRDRQDNVTKVSLFNVRVGVATDNRDFYIEDPAGGK